MPVFGKQVVRMRQIIFAIAGLKGIVSFDLHVKTADADIHSSLAAYIDNAAWRLVRALSSLTDEQNHILIDGFTMISNR